MYVFMRRFLKIFLSNHFHSFGKELKIWLDWKKWRNLNEHKGRKKVASNLNRILVDHWALYMTSITNQDPVERCNTPTHTNTHQHTPTHTNTHQHTPTHTNTHQHTPTHTNTHQNTPTHTKTHRDSPRHTKTHRDSPRHTKTSSNVELYGSGLYTGTKSTKW